MSTDHKRALALYSAVSWGGGAAAATLWVGVAGLRTGTSFPSTGSFMDALVSFFSNLLSFGTNFGVLYAKDCWGLVALSCAVGVLAAGLAGRTFLADGKP